MKNGCAATAVVVIALILVFVLLAVRGANNTTVTLQSPSGSGTVQLFGATNSAAAVLRHLPDGTECEKIDGPQRVMIDGVAMSFYRLKCNGVTGYVNARWVKP